MTTEWKNSLPDDLKASPVIKDIADVPSLVKQFIDQQSHIGASIRIPGENAGEADKKEFYSKLIAKVPGLIPVPGDDKDLTVATFRKLGAPDAPSKYKVPEGVDATDADVKFLADAAFEANLTQAQFQHVAKQLSAINKTMAEEAMTAAADGVKVLKKDWGQAFEGRMGQVEQLLTLTKAPKDTIEALKDGSMGPETTKWLYSMVKALGSEGLNLAKDGDGSGQHRMSPDEARASVEEIMRNKEHAYWNPSSPTHQDAIKKMIVLMSAAYPDASTDPNTMRAGMGG